MDAALTCASSAGDETAAASNDDEGKVSEEEEERSEDIDDEEPMAVSMIFLLSGLRRVFDRASGSVLEGDFWSDSIAQRIICNIKNKRNQKPQSLTFE